MKRHLALVRLLAGGLAALALVVGLTGDARAGFAYGFASQTISNLIITPTITPNGTVTTSTNDGATLNGSGLANSNPLNTGQAYLGGSPAAPEDFFGRYAPGAVPVSPVGNFTRGDAVIASLAQGINSSSVVAESFLNTTIPTSETGNSGLTASLLFTPTATSALTINYNFANDAYVFSTDGGNATASFNFNITIKDLGGAILFSSSTSNTNISLASPPNGGEIIRRGTESVTTTTLTAGTSYSLIFSSIASSSATISAVPEPASFTLLGLGTLGALVLSRRRKARA